MCVGVPRPFHKRPWSHRALLMSESVKFSLQPPQLEATPTKPVAPVAKPVTPEPTRPASVGSKKSVAFAPVESTIAAYIPARCDLDDSERETVWYGPSELEAIKERARDSARRLRLRDLEAEAAEAAAASISSGSDEETSDGESGVLRRYRERCSVALRQSQLRRSKQRDRQHAHHELDDDDLSCPRGFELRLSPLRQRNRALAHRATLEFARRQERRRSADDGSGDSCPAVDHSIHLALVSSKLSRWSREIALSMGHGDFLEAYEVFKGVLPAPRSVEDISREHSFPFAAKKRLAPTVPTQNSGEERRVRRRVC